MQKYQRTHFNPMGAPAMSSLRTPVIRIEGHKSEVLSCDFHPSGKYIASSDRSGQINVCDIYGTFHRMIVMNGHKGAVTEIHFSRDGYDIYSCSTDQTVAIWDTFSGIRKIQFVGHTSGVNSVQGTKFGYPVICSGSADGTVRIWDSREQKDVLTFDSDVNVTATCFNETGEYLFSGGIDKDIKIWDMRRRHLLLKLSGHQGTVSGLSLSPCGRLLLSHSDDDTLRIWDVSPFINHERDVAIFPSNQQGAGNLLRCAWSKDGTLISAATSERDALVWDPFSGFLVHELPGHQSYITDVAFHPRESIILSASNDEYLFLHELYNQIELKDSDCED